MLFKVIQVSIKNCRICKVISFYPRIMNRLVSECISGDDTGTAYFVLLPGGAGADHRPAEL